MTVPLQQARKCLKKNNTDFAWCALLRSCLHDHVPDVNVDLVRLPLTYSESSKCLVVPVACNPVLRMLYAFAKSVRMTEFLQ